MWALNIIGLLFLIQYQSSHGKIMTGGCTGWYWNWKRECGVFVYSFCLHGIRLFLLTPHTHSTHFHHPPFTMKSHMGISFALFSLCILHATLACGHEGLEKNAALDYQHACPSLLYILLWHLTWHFETALFLWIVFWFCFFPLFGDWRHPVFAS